MLLGQNCNGQINYLKSNNDSSITISKVQFDNLVDTCLILLQTKKLEEISDKGHINIMMCLNTIFMHDFTGGQYEKLTKVAKEINYAIEVIKIYPNSIPNRGMGSYFPTLKMELYGTPHSFAIFNVTK
jgi:hypothetical protein